MNPAEMFASEQNLERFFARLRVEIDPERRRILRYLAVAEEDRYGKVQANLDKVERWLGEGEARIARQRRLVAEFGGDSAHLVVAQRLLGNLEELQELMLKFRSALRDAEQRSAP